MICREKMNEVIYYLVSLLLVVGIREKCRVKDNRVALLVEDELLAVAVNYLSARRPYRRGP